MRFRVHAWLHSDGCTRSIRRASVWAAAAEASSCECGRVAESRITDESKPHVRNQASTAFGMHCGRRGREEARRGRRTIREATPPVCRCPSVRSLCVCVCLCPDLEVSLLPRSHSEHSLGRLLLQIALHHHLRSGGGTRRSESNRDRHTDGTSQPDSHRRAAGVQGGAGGVGRRTSVLRHDHGFVWLYLHRCAHALAPVEAEATATVMHTQRPSVCLPRLCPHRCLPSCARVPHLF